MGASDAGKVHGGIEQDGGAGLQEKALLLRNVCKQIKGDGTQDFPEGALRSSRYYR
jgi:hypothetical protein